MIPARLVSGAELAEKKDIQARATAMTAAAKRTHSPCSFKKFFKRDPSQPLNNQAKKRTPKRPSIRLRRNTGRPITLK